MGPHWPVAECLAAAANPIAVAIVKAVNESVASFVVVEPVAMIVAHEMVTNLIHFVVIVARLKRLVVVASAMSAG